MHLPRSTVRRHYISKINIIETHLKDATSSELDSMQLANIQKRLDVLAEKYQHSEELGIARYKLYELQALVHYFKGNDEDALDFINQAVETRGDNYPRAEKLKAQLVSTRNLPKTTDHKKMTKKERRKRLIGLEGWLALFIVGVGSSILHSIINLSGYGSTFNDLSSTSSEVAAYVSAITPTLWFDILTNILSIGLAIWFIALLTKHKKMAKTIAIVYLVSGALLLVVDYTWMSSVFSTFHVTQYLQPELSRASGDVGGGIISMFIWVPYFLVSKRVKATLIN